MSYRRLALDIGFYTSPEELKFEIVSDIPDKYCQSLQNRRAQTCSSSLDSGYARCKGRNESECRSQSHQESKVSRMQLRINEPIHMDGNHSQQGASFH